jgi:hypothetical protein
VIPEENTSESYMTALDNIPQELRRKDAKPTVEVDNSNSAF